MLLTEFFKALLTYKDKQSLTIPHLHANLEDFRHQAANKNVHYHGFESNILTALFIK